MAEDTSFPFSTGEAVVYPNQGLCNIIGIAEKEVANQKLLFIQLVRQADGAKVMVPTQKALSIGLRKIATHSEVLDVIEFLKSDSDKASLDWKTRARTNTEHMARGSLMGLAEVVKALQVLSELRPLPTKERELYNNARGMLVEEMAAALGIEPGDAEDSMDVILFPLGKARPRRTVEEFRLGMENAELLALEDDVLLEPQEEEEEENNDDDAEQDDFSEALTEEDDNKGNTNLASAKASATKAKKKDKTSASKTSKAASNKRALAKTAPPGKTPKKACAKSAKTKADKTKADKTSKTNKAAQATTAAQASGRSSSSKKKAL